MIAGGSVEILKNRIAEHVFDRRFDQRKAVQFAGHGEVGQHEVRPQAPVQDRQRRRRVFGLRHREPMVLRFRSHHLADIRLVLHQQNGRVHF